MANELISVVVQLKDKFSGKLKGINKSVSGFSKGILSSRLSLAALSATIGLAINDFAKFEKKMVDVGNLFGATQSEVQALSKEVLDISKRIPQSAQVLSDALFDVVSAGIAVKDSTKFLETAAKLATAGVTDTKIAVDGLTTVINAYSFSAEDAKVISDKFFAAQVRGKTTIAELSSSIGRVASIGASANISINELLGSISALTTKGIKTDEAVTGLRAAITSIIDPSSEAESLAKKLGIEFNAAAIKSKGFEGVLNDVKTATGGNIKQLSTLFNNVRGLNAVLALSNDDFTALKSVVDDVSNAMGGTEKAFNQQLLTVSSTLTILSNKIKAFSNSLINELVPIIRLTSDLLSMTFKRGAETAEKSLRDIQLNLALNEKIRRDLLIKREQTENRFAKRLLKFQIDTVSKRISILKLKEQKLTTSLEKENKKRIEDVSKSFKKRNEIIKISSEKLGEFGRDAARDYTGAFSGIIGSEFSSGGSVNNAIIGGLSAAVPGIGAFLGGAVTGIMGGLLGNIFGSSPVKTVAQIAQEAFDKMIKKTNRALDSIRGEKDIFTEQLNILEDLMDEIGVKGIIPTELLDHLQVTAGTTVQEAILQKLKDIEGTNIDLNSELGEKLERAEEKRTVLEKAVPLQEKMRALMSAANLSTSRGLHSLARGQQAGASLIGTELAELTKGFKFEAGISRGELEATEKLVKELESQGAKQISEKQLERLRETLALQRRAAKLEKFATGGIVSGNNTAGDRLSVAVNSGEMVLNKAQQSNLFNAISSGQVGGGANSVNITFSGAVLGDQSQAREFALKIDEELFKLKRNNQSVAFN